MTEHDRGYFDVKSDKYGPSVLRAALEESIKLQSHYAGLLNMYDQGRRMQFENGDAGIERLKETGKVETEAAE